MRDFPVFLDVDRDQSGCSGQAADFVVGVEGERMAMGVDAGESRAQLMEGGGAEAGERQLAAGLLTGSLVSLIIRRIIRKTDSVAFSPGTCAG